MAGEPRDVEPEPGILHDALPGDAPTDADGDADPEWAARVAAAGILGFSIAWVVTAMLAEQGLYGNPSRALEVNLYRQYAGNVLHGLVPYRDFAFEYPPLALVPILGPLLLIGNLTEIAYRQAFGLVTATIGMVTTIFVMRAAVALDLRRRDMLAGAALVATSPILMGPLMLARFDLWPALFAAAAIWLFVTDRYRLAAVALGLGVLAKVYPVVLAPFLVVHLWRQEGRRAATVFTLILVLTVAVGVAPFFVVAPQGVLDALLRAFTRPLQVETVGAALIFLANAMGGVRVVHTFDSYNLIGPLASQVATAQTVALGVLLLVTFVLFIRGRPTLERLMLASAAALCAWVAFGKVLSPQYLIWLIAPIAMIRGRRWSPHLITLGTAILLTGLYYPRFYSRYLDVREPLWVAVVLARDLLLVAITLYLVARLVPRDRATD
ncbi:MAG: DUF2029 domain-containing protein [Chloroflexi bacterium]|nr:DUF2029 domain-containing protein [Chloroflexota bacterium]